MKQSVKCQVIRPTCQVELDIMSRFLSFPPSSNNPLHEHTCYIVKLLFSEASKVCVPVYSAHVCLPMNALSGDRKSTRLNSSHQIISYAVFCLKKKNY